MSRDPTIVRMCGLLLFCILSVLTSPAWAASIPMKSALRSLPAGDNPVEVLAGSLDEDSHVDLVAVNANSSDLSPFLGNGDGTFRVLPRIATSIFPRAAGRGDLNEDGYDDWVVCGGTPTLVIHWGGPSGPGAPASLSDPTGAVSCLVTRIDDDAYLDLVIVRSPNVLSVRLGNGDGTFQPPVEYSAGTDAKGVAAGDLNGDGHTDVVVGHTSGTTISVFYGHAGGSLDSPVAISMSTGPSEVAVADLNADGRRDLVAGAGGTVVTRLGNPGGGFSFAQNFPGGQNGIAIADFDRDGRPDVVGTATTSDATLLVQIGDGYGGLLPPIETTIGPAPTTGPSGRLCVADFDGDGIPDVAAIVGNIFSVIESPITVLLGNGDGTFPGPRVLSPGGGVVNGIQVGDTDGDGHADLVLGTAAGELFTFLGDGTGSFPGKRTGIAFTKGWQRLGDFNEDGTPDLVDADGAGFAIRHGAGDGTFTIAPYVSSGSGMVDIGDVQPDGHLDVVAMTTTGGMVHLGNGDGTVGAGVGVSSAFLPHVTKGVHFADINADGRDDLVFWHTDHLPTVVLTAAGPSYGPGISFAAGFTSLDLDTGDFDGDGKLDVATVYAGTAAGSLWKGGGNGTFTLLDSYDTGSSPDVRTGRFNDDDSLDFAVTNSVGGTIAIRAGDGDGTFAGREDFAVGGRIGVMEPGDLDSDGVQDLAFGLQQTGRVALLLSTGAPRLPIATHFVARVQGPAIEIEWLAAEPSRWAEFAVERAQAGDGGWQRLALTTTTRNDTTVAIDDTPPDGSIWYRIAARTSDGQWFFSGPVPARDALVPALVSLESARVEAGCVRLRWVDAAKELSGAVVERCDDGTSWQPRSPVRADGSGVLEFVDDEVRPGARYGYRLAFEENGAQARAGETWVDVPATGVALSAPSPQRARGGLNVSWQLAQAGDAVIRLYDLAGRKVISQSVRAGDSAVRHQSLATHGDLAPGIYLATLESGPERRSVRVVVLR